MGDRAMRRAWALLAAVGLLAGGCALLPGDEEEPAAPQSPPTLPAAAAVLRVASTEWPQCLNPLTCDDPDARWLVWEHVLPRLLEVAADGEYRPSPVLARPPETQVDPVTGRQTITYAIDEDARWHDGRPITSSDVTGTWLAHLATPGAPMTGYELIESVDDRDPLVARVTLSAPYADWPELFGGHTGWLLQADAFGGDVDLTGRFEDGLGFGAGPFELASFDDRAIGLVARDEHWDADRQAAADQVRIERLPADATDELAEAVSAGIDLVWAPGATEVPERFSAVERPTAEVLGVFFDRRTPALGSGLVRQAVDAAVDRRELLDELGGDPDDLLTCLGWLPQQPPCEDDLPEGPGSAVDAEALLDVDAWLRGPDGFRGRPDLPLLVPVSYDPRVPGAEDVAEAVAEELVPLGFGVVVQPADESTWLDGARTGSTGIGIFRVTLGTAGRVADLYRCEAGDLNPLGWCEGPNQELARELLATPDRGARTEVARELGDLAAEARSWLPLRQRTVRLLVDRDRVEVPEQVRLGSGPLGGLHRFGRVEG